MCNASHLENQIRERLEYKNITYTPQTDKTILIWLGLQTLDFYLPEHKIAIECQGIQHFEPVDFFGGEEEYNKIIELDQRKARLCKENGVRLLYYTNVKLDEYPYEVYTDIDELMKEITKQDKL